MGYSKNSRIKKAAISDGKLTPHTHYGYNASFWMSVTANDVVHAQEKIAKAMKLRKEQFSVKAL